MSREQALRTVMFAAPAEMALVRRDPVAGALLVQAARAAAGSDCEEALIRASDICRGLDLEDLAPASAAARKVAMALTRLSLHLAGRHLLG